MQRSLAALVLVLFVLPAWSQDKDAKKELDKLQGEWKLVAGEAGGVKLPERELDNTTMTIKGDVYDYVSPADKEKGKMTLNTGATPAHVDMDVTEGAAQGRKQLGIYELKGDRIKFCVALAGETKRPTKFETDPENKFMIFEFEKIKK